MKTDISKEMFEKYMKYDDNRVRIQFSDGHIETGILAGHYHEDSDLEDYHIREWDFVPCETSKEENDCLENKKHLKILQKHILGVYFYADKSILKTE